MSKALVVGAQGRMGQEIISVLKDSPLGFYEGVDIVEPWKNFAQIDPKQASIVIDFSTPESLLSTIDWCSKNCKALVSGTTGITKREEEALAKLSQTQPVLWAANMSMGVNFVAELVKQFSALEEDFDFQIEEAHHRHKKDKPSGTAILLQDSLQSVLKEKLPEALSIRGGGIFGIHKIMAMSEEETISLEHVALNRRVFAKGAVQAASWMVGKAPGTYTMKDVLGLS